MTRTEKWRYKRVQLDAEREMFANALLNASEKIMKVHSDIFATRRIDDVYTKGNLDDLFDSPLDQIDELMQSLKEKKRFLCD